MSQIYFFFENFTLKIILIVSRTFVRKSGFIIYVLSGENVKPFSPGPVIVI